MDIDARICFNARILVARAKNAGANSVTLRADSANEGEFVSLELDVPKA